MSIQLINSDYSNLKTLVINLDDYKDNYLKQLPHLESIGLKVERFKGINALKDQHLKPEYLQYISNFALHFTPKSVIGCALSHIFCCKHIYENYIINKSSYRGKTPYFLIMEDDAYPLLEKTKFYEKLNKTIYEIQILDPNWEIIQLHSDAFFPNYETYNTHFACGSTAAYLISCLGLKKILKTKIYSHADFIEQNFVKYRKYKAKHNLFYTNETTSLNRNINKIKNFKYYSLFFKSYVLELFNKYTNLLELRGEKKYENFLEFKLLKLPFINNDYNSSEIIDILFFIFLIKKLFN